MVWLINFGSRGRTRTARKQYRCDTFTGWPNPEKSCGNIIRPGDKYVEGDSNDNAGGFGCDRHCMECAEKIHPLKAEAL